MSRSDRTGPMIERQAGICAGYSALGYMSTFSGRGAYGRCGGRGRRFFIEREVYQPAQQIRPTKEKQIPMLEQEMEALKERIEELRKG